MQLNLCIPACFFPDANMGVDDKVIDRSCLWTEPQISSMFSTAASLQLPPTMALCILYPAFLSHPLRRHLHGLLPATVVFKSENESIAYQQHPLKWCSIPL